MSERTPLYESPVVSRVLLEREQEVKRAAGVLAGEYGISREDWFQIRDEMVKKGVPQFSADQLIIDMGKKKAEKPDIRETHIMTPVSVDQVETRVEEKIVPTQEAPISGAKPGKIILFRTPRSGDLAKSLRAATISETAITK